MANNVKLYYNYLYIDPTDNKIFYIGKGTGKRSTEHLCDVKKHRIPNHRNYPFYKKIKSLLDIGKVPIIVVLNYTQNEQDAYTQERVLIEKAKNNNQPLCNLSNGGDGFTSEENSISSKKRWANPEYRKKMSKISGEAQRKEEAREQTSRLFKQLWKNKEFREKMIKAAKEKSSTNEFKLRMSKIATEYSNKPEIKEKRIQQLRERWADPEFKKKVSKKISTVLRNNIKIKDARKKLWQNIQYREKMCGIFADPERRKRLSEKRKTLWLDPEYRAKIEATRNDSEHKKKTSESRKAMWRDPVYRAKSHEAQRLARLNKKEMRMVI